MDKFVFIFQQVFQFLIFKRFGNIGFHSVGLNKNNILVFAREHKFKFAIDFVYSSGRWGAVPIAESRKAFNVVNQCRP